MKKTNKSVSFDKDAVVKDLSDGINHRAILPPDFYINNLGFAKSDIKHLIKTFKSDDPYPAKQIFLDGEPVASATGVLYYDFLIWFADRLGIDKDAGFSGGGRQPYAWHLREKILKHFGVTVPPMYTITPVTESSPK